MYVCLCAAVTDQQIEQAARRGCGSLEALGAELGVGAGCGCCREMAAGIAAQAVGGLMSVTEARRFSVAA